MQDPNDQPAAAGPHETPRCGHSATLAVAPAPGTSSLGPWLALAGLVLVFQLANFAIAPLMDIFNQQDWGAVWVYAAAGTISAQAALLTFALVFAPGRFFVRLAAVGATSLVFFGAWAAGVLCETMFETYGPTNRLTSWWNTTRFAALALPLIALALQLPLWPFRIYFGWRLEPTGGSPPVQAPRLLDYFVGTALVAAAFTSARLAAEESTASDYWLAWFVTGASIAGASLLSILPAMLLVLRRRWWVLGVILNVLYALLVFVAIVGVAALLVLDFRNELRRPFGQWTAFGMALMVCTFAALLAVGLRLLTHALGVELVLGRRSNDSIASITATPARAVTAAHPAP